MRTVIAIAISALLAAGLCETAKAHDDFYGGGGFHAGYYGGFGFGGPGFGGPSFGYGYPGFAGGYSTFGYGFAPVSQTVVSTTFYQPAIVPPMHFGGVPYQFGALGYPYRYYTHLPGYSFSYHSGMVPTYYPGQFGYGYGYNGYGPFGW